MYVFSPLLTAQEISRKLSHYTKWIKLQRYESVNQSVSHDLAQMKIKTIAIEMEKQNNKGTHESNSFTCGDYRKML